MIADEPEEPTTESARPLLTASMARVTLRPGSLCVRQAMWRDAWLAAPWRALAVCGPGQRYRVRTQPG